MTREQEEAIAGAMTAREELRKGLDRLDESIADMLLHRQRLQETVDHLEARGPEPFCTDSLAPLGPLCCDLGTGHDGEHELILVRAGHVVRVTWEPQ